MSKFCLVSFFGIDLYFLLEYHTCTYFLTNADQKNGILLDVWRKDGGSFSGTEINIKYHATEKTGVVWAEFQGIWMDGCIGWVVRIFVALCSTGDRPLVCEGTMTSYNNYFRFIIIYCRRPFKIVQYMQCRQCVPCISTSPFGMVLHQDEATRERERERERKRETCCCDCLIPRVLVWASDETKQKQKKSNKCSMKAKRSNSGVLEAAKAKEQHSGFQRSLLP